jgi:nitroreductase
MLYEAIFQRKSVRKYKKDDIEEALLHNIKLKIETLKPLFEDIGYEIKILRREEVSNNWAPSYIAIYSEKKPGYLLNAGYLLQQIDLFVQSIGLGSCWIGLARPHLSKQKRYGFVIMLSVGYPEQDISRTKEDFKRKTLLEITDIEDSNLMEAVRLAPSAVNSQPWFFAKSEDGIDIYRSKKGFHALALNTWNQIDIGIAIIHLELSLQHQNKSYEYFKKINSKKRPGFEYVLSVQLKDN